MIEDDVHVEVVSALIAEHRRELAESRALNVLYRMLLEAAGIDAPDDPKGAEAVRRYQAVFIAAGEHDPLQPRELTDDWWTPIWPALAGIERGAPFEWPTVGVSRIVA